MGSDWQYGVTMDLHKGEELIPACFEEFRKISSVVRHFPQTYFLITCGSQFFIHLLFTFVMQHMT